MFCLKFLDRLPDMPNLETVINNPEERKSSIHRMMGGTFGRAEVRSNHGIKNQQELQDRLCAPPFEAGAEDERTAAFTEMLG